jgi:hypothetical protein
MLSEMEINFYMNIYFNNCRLSDIIYIYVNKKNNDIK